jgi:hypothetical protein
MLQCDEMLVCEGVGRIQNEGSEVKCSGQASAIPGIFLYACTHTQVLIPKFKIIFKIIYSSILKHQIQDVQESKRIVSVITLQNSGILLLTSPLSPEVTFLMLAIICMKLLEADHFFVTMKCSSFDI